MFKRRHIGNKQKNAIIYFDLKTAVVCVASLRIAPQIKKNEFSFFFFSFFFFAFCRYNGFLPQGDKGRRRSKFVLYKRAEANGVRRSRHYIVQSPQTSKAILDANQHSISYTLSRNQAVIVEYKEDADTDMFQVKCASSFSKRKKKTKCYSLLYYLVVKCIHLNRCKCRQQNSK